ncbi:MAG: REP element-mobilizing transposase RayT [Halioglobus sp.]|jgi:REP element-mobilizing transposase RayT
MPKPRKAIVCRSDTPYYHCVSRCVRRAYLCGHDQSTGESYEHRRDWIAQRLHILASLFTIDVCAYAVMSNHYHLVIKLSTSSELSDEEVLTRWLTLFKGPVLVQRFQSGAALSPAQQTTVTDIINVWRERLQDLSWFMKCLNEPIARQANQEDGCTGHFWEARFKSQPLLTQEALLTCMAYVDLNPIRAGMANSPEESDFTSIQERVKPTTNPVLSRAVADTHGLQPSQTPIQLQQLLHFEEATRFEPQTGIPFAFKDYLALVDTTGRIVRADKRGVIPPNLAPILTRLNLTPDQWLINSTQFESVFYRRFRQAV